MAEIIAEDDGLPCSEVGASKRISSSSFGATDGSSVGN